MKRFVVVLTLALLFALAVPAAALPPKGHDHSRVTATFSCAADGTQTITWLIENFTRDTSMTIAAWNTTPDASVPVSSVLPPLGSTTASAVVTPGTTQEVANLTADWPTLRQHLVDVAIPVPACSAVTTTTVAATTTEGTIPGQGSTVAPPTSAGTSSSVPGGTLPFTGSTSGWLLALGVALAGIGGVLASIGRTQRVVARTSSRDR